MNDDCTSPNIDTIPNTNWAKDYCASANSDVVANDKRSPGMRSTATATTADNTSTNHAKVFTDHRMLGDNTPK